MPKLIGNLRETILRQAKQLLLEEGYPAFTMRETAARCGIAVGTLYNYYPSKEALAAGIMLEDWRAVLARMEAACAGARDVAEGLDALLRGVSEFRDRYRGIWAGFDSGGNMSPEFARRHRLLVRQIAGCLAPVLARCGTSFPPQTDLFLAENVLACTGYSEVSPETLKAVAQRLLGGAPEARPLPSASRLLGGRAY